MTQIKICGIRNKGHALAATEAGANFIGLVFAPSKRRVTPAEAREITMALRQYSETLNAGAKNRTQRETFCCRGSIALSQKPKDHAFRKLYL